MPGLWTELPGLEHADHAVYDKDLTCAGTLRFMVGGAGQRAKMWLDGRELGGQEAPYQPFEGLAEDVPYGAHCLRIAVDNRGGEAAGAGLVQEVEIEQLGSALITGLTVTPRREGRVVLADVRVTVRSLAKKHQVMDVELKAGPASMRWKRRLLPARGTVTLSSTLPLPGLGLWSPEHPALYTAEAVLWLDGEPVDDLLERFCCRKDAAPACHAVDVSALGSVPSLHAMLAFVETLHAQGHALRLGSSPVPPVLLDLCDEIGVQVT